jgi:NAD(P)-dependent dehydrogenase (short-subunit alcohol dehydrogenase family)
VARRVSACLESHPGAAQGYFGCCGEHLCERAPYPAHIAGYGAFGAVEEATDAQARAIFDTNVFGPLNVLRATLPVLRGQRSGHILQGSSLYGQSAHPGVGLLAASKYALEGLSDALAAELAPWMSSSP